MGRELRTNLQRPVLVFYFALFLFLLGFLFFTAIIIVIFLKVVLEFEDLAEKIVVCIFEFIMSVIDLWLVYFWLKMIVKSHFLEDVPPKNIVIKGRKAWYECNCRCKNIPYFYFFLSSNILLSIYIVIFKYQHFITYKSFSRTLRNLSSLTSKIMNSTFIPTLSLVKKILPSVSVILSKGMVNGKITKCRIFAPK